MRFNDAVFGVILILFALAMMLYARTFPEMHGQAYGPALFPNIVGSGLIICGVLLTLSGLRRLKSTGLTDFADWAGDRSRLIDGALIPAMLLAYILVADWLGFIPTAFLIMMVLFLRYRVNLLLGLALAVVTTLGIHTLFNKFLLVPLPWGLLEEFAW